uniref:Uncharacterized protein n=1 Tax=Avena sativa TaxID=4498 RepID=A0ACD5UIU6_AVESA
MGQVSLLRVLHEEAVGVIGDTGMDGINPKTVLDCFRYSLFPATPEHTLVDYDWATHACNYWICDGILGDEKAWDIGNALYGVVPWLDNSTDWLLARCVVDQKKKGWYSIKLTTHDISSVPHNASSYFLTFKGHCPLNVHNDLFQLASNNLRVLMLCNCSFDFESPPFQCCHNLRFLWLDHCANTGKKEQSGVPIFLNLMVFDSRFTYWVLFPQMVERMTNLRELNTKGVSWKTMSHACRKLHKLHKLRVTESPDVVTVDSCSVVDMMNLELLDLSGNTHMESLPALSSARCLKMLVLDGCSSLENIVLDMERAPPLLESFSFDGYGPTKNWTHTIHLPQKESRLKSRIDSIEIAQVTNISLRGCGRLQNIFLHALPNLEELDLSGTSIRTLDLGAMDIAYCGNLRHVFPLDNKYPREISPIQSGVTFLHLKQIKLYHLHKLEQICETKSIAPSLQTIGLRDCWALRRLPAVAREGPKPVVDCEKDWWNKLEWDGLDAGHHPSLFETRHSAYYKKTLPRVSFLR